MTSTTSPRVYIASLSAYNAGKLHGVWIDLDGKDESDIQDEVNAMLATCPENALSYPSEEWAIHDYDLGGIKIGESESFETLVNLAKALEDHGEKFALAFDNFGDLDEAVQACEDSYQGVFSTLEDYAIDYMEQSGILSEVPETLRNYFDFARFGKDCEVSGDIWTARGEDGLHVFSNN